MTIIGTIEVPAGTRQQSYEVAAWYRTFEHEAQTCEVHSDGNKFGNVTYRIEGRYTYNHFPSLFGGVATGGGDIGEIDEPGTFGVQIYNYGAAALVEEGLMVLDDEVAGVEVTYFDHPVYCAGYVTDHAVEIGSGGDRYPACEHESHDDPHGALLAERDDRGHLPRGYVTGVKDRKRHAHIGVR